MVLADGMLIAVADVGDVIPTEPMFCLLSNEDVLFVWHLSNFLTNFGPIPVELIFEHILVLILNLYYWAYLGIPKFIGPRN